MKKLLAIIFGLMSLSVFAQTNGRQLAPGAMENFNALLNKSGFAQATTATALGKGWFRLDSDVHIFTDEVSIGQVAGVLLDLENMPKYFQGKKNRAEATVVQRGDDEVIMDFVSINPVLAFQIKTPYRASLKVLENSETSVCMEVSQLAADSQANNSIRNLFISRYACEVIIGDKTYTYIRFVIQNEINTSILPGARGVLEKNSDSANVEAQQLLIKAAKTK